jgi:murein DD-endopeptidase MepM/ murein hydrolase activator NlpD
MQKRFSKIVVGILIGVILIFSQLAPGQASDLQKKKDELSKVNRQIEEQKKQINENQKKQKDVLQELDDIDRDISQASQDLERIDGELSALQKSIEQNEKELRQREEKLQERTEIFNQRLRDMYMEGNLSFLGVLLESTSMSDFLTRFDLMKYIADQDSKLVGELSAERDRVAREKRQLEAKKEEAVVLKRTTTAKKTYLAARGQDRKTTLSSLQSDKAASERAVQEMEAASRQITQIIQQYQSSGSSNSSSQSPRKGTGRFIKPANGGVTSGYGMRWHPISGQYKMHTGIDFGASYGSPIWAADGGMVIYAGWMSGYGNTVVIDHGGGVSTLYGHMSSIAVGNGAGVNQGQVVGKVGSTGNSTGPHLHFEVRINGNHTNPVNYL